MFHGVSGDGEQTVAARHAHPYVQCMRISGAKGRSSGANEAIMEWGRDCIDFRSAAAARTLRQFDRRCSSVRVNDAGDAGAMGAKFPIGRRETPSPPSGLTTSAPGVPPIPE